MSAARTEPAALPAPRRWLRAQLRALLAALGELSARPVSTLMTAAVIGIALALPAGLYLAVSNLAQLRYGWEGAAEVSLFLRDEVDAIQGDALAGRLAQRPELSAVRYISREQALEEFRRVSGFGAALDALDDNPLPAAVVVTPRAALPPARVGPLLDELAALPEVELVQRDQQWLERLYLILDLLRRGAMLLAVLLGVAVAITVSNTVRLALADRREEVLVLKLLGASNAFIRRPFLWTGFWYGFIGSFLALALIALAGWLLSPPLLRLAGLYDTPLSFGGPSAAEIAALITAGIGLGLLGAALTLRRHLAGIEPI